MTHWYGKIGTDRIGDFSENGVPEPYWSGYPENPVNDWVACGPKPTSEGVFHCQEDGKWLEVTTKEQCLSTILLDIDEKNRTENLKDFFYANGDGEIAYPYVADRSSISAVALETHNCPPTDPIPTIIKMPNGDMVSGKWKTNQVEADGLTPIYLDYTCEEYQAFKSWFFARGTSNFGVKEFHKNNLKAMCLDDTKTVEDMRAYDYSTGWF